MARINRFEDLEAWKLARSITKDVYFVANKGAFRRDFGLRDQICRSSVSVMSNIAEGFERDGDREFVNFLSIAKGSSGELRSHLYVALDQNYISETEFSTIYERTDQNSRVIAGLMNYLKDSEFRGLKYK